MINLEIDGKSVQVPPGSTVMDAARSIGAYIPHFCYHRKLSIAANCRMCLVQVEKAPKPLPACATPVTEGMKVFTASDYARQAQKAVMEFLLINHPLDCPICDQGGECQLQDLAVGYGKSESRYREEKRVVFVKNLGPLISAEEMSRCIHCTRCVRFGQEIAGNMELGMYGRGEHSEILAFVGASVDSELSGNMIDVCPVGALTSKPFRYSARTWELQRRRSVSPHDALGTNIQVQIKHDRVMRVLPLENEALNECWISDRDRFSYEGLYAADRLTQPMIRHADAWQPSSWQDALAATADYLRAVAATHGGNEVAIVLGAHATVEEAFLARQLAEALGSHSIDARLGVTDADFARSPALDLGFRLEDIDSVDRFLVIGSSLRQEQPLLAGRIRQRVKRGGELSIVSVLDDDPLCSTAGRLIVPPSQLAATLEALAEVVERRKAGTEGAQPSAKPEDAALGVVAASLIAGKKTAVLIGELAQAHPHAARLRVAAQRIARAVAGTCGETHVAASVLGASLVGARPAADGKPAARALTEGARAFLLVGTEPEFDSSAGAAASAALARADKVIALTTFAGEGLKRHAHVLLPLSPFTETSGTWVAQDGTVQSISGVARPLGEARPGWKILRVLAGLMGAAVENFDSSEAIRRAALPVGMVDAMAGAHALAIDASTVSNITIASGSRLERIADLPIYGSDPIVRRAPALQSTRYAQQALRARVHPTTAAQLGLRDGQRVLVKNNGGSVECQLGVDTGVPSGCLRLSRGTVVHAALSGADWACTIEPVVGSESTAQTDTQEAVA